MLLKFDETENRPQYSQLLIHTTSHPAKIFRVTIYVNIVNHTVYLYNIYMNKIIKVT